MTKGATMSAACAIRYAQTVFITSCKYKVLSTIEKVYHPVSDMFIIFGEAKNLV
jgi:hypothetical protein